MVESDGVRERLSVLEAVVEYVPVNEIVGPLLVTVEGRE